LPDRAQSPRQPLLRRLVSEMLVGGHGRIGSTVYGTLIVLTALTASYAAEKHEPWKLVELVATAVFVFWIAYIYAHALSESIESRSHLSRPTLANIAGRELGLLFSAVAPILALLLGAVGAISESTSIWVAIAVGLATLSAQGLRYAYVTHLSPAGAAAILVMNLLLGVCVIALKVTLVH
jgi:hypothetical protein